MDRLRRWNAERLSRREVLRCSLAGVAGLTLTDLLRLRATAASPGGDTAIMLVWLPGGASHIETYDPKPLAPSEFRGPYSPIATNVAGIDVCELLPQHARVADRFTLLRSMVHTGFCHQQGTHQLLTGHEVRELKNQPDHPDVLSIACKLRGNVGRAIPRYVGVPPVNYSGAAYLGPAYQAFSVYGDPNDTGFSVPNIGLADEQAQARLGDRINLRRQFDTLRRDVDRKAMMRAFDEFESQAWDLLTAEAAREAFDLSHEPDSLRDRYGRNEWGQRALLGRRLVEAGVDLVTVQFGGSLCGRVGNWDDHAVNHHVFEAMKLRTRYYDQAVSALIEDIYDRGLDRRVMVVVTGEFGRTPRISYQQSTGGGVGSGPTGTTQPGRDHWPRATSMLFAGGGITTGQVIGATDQRGEDAVTRIVGRTDFLATLYRHLGIDPDGVAFDDFAGRPIPVPSGTVIDELTA
mgnify:CR=1 FL=1